MHTVYTESAALKYDALRIFFQVFRFQDNSSIRYDIPHLCPVSHIRDIGNSVVPN